ncbi:McrB family protein [Brevibacillus borstelensis]|uniref:McrB family protein n=1 Tax=Brevibacillus borstelensis TaxID=45462 RepID=UPI002E1B0F39|nr:AAA family ATPase [Brevibacillus borstelensis]MED1876669.1 AAA family ATPase [Brevibacillus borstelensis]
MTNPVQEFLDHADYQLESKSDINTVDIDIVLSRISKKQDVILYGPPGTGKSYMIDNVTELLGERKGLSKTIQFHAEYTYDDFVEGLKPNNNGGFSYVKGDFFQFCEDVKDADPQGNKIHTFFIDEINRANITSVFGELMYLIEGKGKRILPTARTKTPFFIPNNVVIIGTMNTADRSLGKFDFALRRRFRFLPVYPDHNILKQMILKFGFTDELKSSLNEDAYINAFRKLNNKIRIHPLLGKELTLGHVLWMPKLEEDRKISVDDIGDVFRELILPQLESYCGSNKETLGSLIGPNLRDDLIMGRYIANESVIAFLVSLQNNHSGENHDN